MTRPNWPTRGGKVHPEDLPSVKRATYAVFLVTRLEHRAQRSFTDDDAVEVYRRFRALDAETADDHLAHLRDRLGTTRPLHPSIRHMGIEFDFERAAA